MCIRFGSDSLCLKVREIEGGSEGGLGGVCVEHTGGRGGWGGEGILERLKMCSPSNHIKRKLTNMIKLMASLIQRFILVRQLVRNVWSEMCKDFLQNC